MSALQDFIRLFESGHQSGPVFASTANELAESLGGKPCITHETDQTTAVFYLMALVAVKMTAQ
ncbi:hypothetical protein HBO14_11205 [Pseudomonas sp. WS 5406]|uniref:hypothetical protein n=1 Tax=Pseudomonas sp. WS 5406 TaxID=2717498 RepID=UPI001475B1AC|nr:hypothetical protein [Pseudomonas sp. WS 5406]NMX27093.1 hypothetical protein [Pseudomonas sp. WS 5406]